MTDGVILWSGGLDSTALGLILQDEGLDLVPIYCQHRPTGGGVTAREIRAASELAREVWDVPLLIVKAPAKGREPDWYDELGEVVLLEGGLLPVHGHEKDWRNRRFLQVLEALGCDRGVVALGALGPEGELEFFEGEHSMSPDYVRDISHDELARWTRGKLVTPHDLGLGKADLVAAARDELLWDTDSCRFYSRKPCGRCVSCRARVQAFLAAWGEDRSRYKRGSWADKLRRRSR